MGEGPLQQQEEVLSGALRVGDLRAVLFDELAQALADRMFVLMDDRIGRVVLGQDARRRPITISRQPASGSPS